MHLLLEYWARSCACSTSCGDRNVATVGGPSQPRALLTSSAELRHEVRRQNNGITDLFLSASRNVYLFLFSTWEEKEEG